MFGGQIRCTAAFIFSVSLKKSDHLKHISLCRNLEFKSIGWKEFQRVHNCVNFPHAQSYADFISIMKLIMEQTIIVSIYLFSVFLNIANVYFVIENNSTSASCNFPAKFLLIPRHTCTSYFASALCLDCILYMVGRVWSMISHLSDINVVFDKRFLQKERKLKK